MKIVILDGYTINPGDLSWSRLEKYGELTVYEAFGMKVLIASNYPDPAFETENIAFTSIGSLFAASDIISLIDAAAANLEAWLAGENINCVNLKAD